MAESSDSFDLFPSSLDDIGSSEWMADPDPAAARPRVFVRDDEKRPSSTGADSAAPVPAAPDMRTAARGAGVGVLFAAAGAAAGAAVGGLWGAGAGLLLAGALRNGARARKLWSSADTIQRQEAATSATMAVIGGGVAVYLGYRAHQERNAE